MITKSDFEILCFGDFSTEELSLISEEIKAGIHLAAKVIAVGDGLMHPGMEAIGRALSMLEEHVGCLKNANPDTIQLTLSFFHDGTVPLGFSKDEMKKLSDYCDIVSIDVYLDSEFSDSAS